MARPREYQEEKVLDAIMDVFWRRGFESTSAQDLVDATGLTRSSLYNAFVNKKGLFEQALMRYTVRTAQHVDCLDEASSKKQAIKSLLTDIVKTDHKHSAKRGCLITNTAIELIDNDERVLQLVRQNFAMLEQALHRNIQQGQNSGEISKHHDAANVAACILNTMQGLRVLSKASSETEHKRLNDIIETSLAALL